MSSKLILLLGLFFAVALLISSEVAAASRDLAETTNAVDPSVETKGDAVNDAKYGGGGGRGRGRYCRYGCCGRSYNRRGCRCCTFAGEKAEVETKN
ncbi:glycine-rich protein-like [Salvia splendens]|nr:glycine-rich protein-like [Salvia splendens]